MDLRPPQPTISPRQHSHTTNRRCSTLRPRCIDLNPRPRRLGLSRLRWCSRTRQWHRSQYRRTYSRLVHILRGHCSACRAQGPYVSHRAYTDSDISKAAIPHFLGSLTQVKSFVAFTLFPLLHMTVHNITWDAHLSDARRRLMRTTVELW